MLRIGGFQIKAGNGIQSMDIFGDKRKKKAGGDQSLYRVFISELLGMIAGGVRVKHLIVCPQR